MNKEEFLAALRQELSGLPQEDIEERLNFYAEMIDDRAEEGISQEEAVAEIGDPKDIAAQVIAETPLPKLVKERVRRKRRLKAWEIVLLAIGSPIWISLLIAAFAVILSLYITLWALIITLWAVEFALAVSAPACIAAAVLFAAQGYGLSAAATLGAALFSAGISIFLFFGCRESSKGIIRLTKKIALGIKSLFIRKEDAQ